MPVSRSPGHSGANFICTVDHNRCVACFPIASRVLRGSSQNTPFSNCELYLLSHAIFILYPDAKCPHVLLQHVSDSALPLLSQSSLSSSHWHAMAPQKRPRNDEAEEEIVAVESASSSLRQDSVGSNVVAFGFLSLGPRLSG